jgi:hypothetical protein
MKATGIARPLSFGFSTNPPEKTSLYLIKTACDSLIAIDSLLLDDFCMAFGKTYLLAERAKEESAAVRNEEEVVATLAGELGKSKQAASAGQVFRNIRLVYEFLSASKVGFLRGDLHTKTFFELAKDIAERIRVTESTQRRQEIYYQQEDFLRVLNAVTDPVHFRIPTKGIYQRELESRVNLYHRQVLLEEVSSTQSHDKL